MKELYYSINMKNFVYKVESNLRLTGVIVSLEDLRGNKIGGFSERYFQYAFIPVPKCKLITILYGEE